jgi:hypothetical protein
VKILDDEVTVKSEFQFSHPKWHPRRAMLGGWKVFESHKEYAKRLVLETFGEKHVADLDWDNCVIENN